MKTHHKTRIKRLLSEKEPHELKMFIAGDLYISVPWFTDVHVNLLSRHSADKLKQYLTK